MPRLLLILPIGLLAGCSLVADYLLKDDTGINVDAQIGSNETKVDTGIGSLGLDSDTDITVTDSKQVSVSNTDDRYHITTEGDTTVNVYETNRWLYAVFGIFLMGKPAIRQYRIWKEKREEIHEHEYCSYTARYHDSDVDRNL